MAARRHARRTTLGLYATAALPAIWREMDLRGWTIATLAKSLEMNGSTATHLVYGDHSAGRRVAGLIARVLGVDVQLWDQPCPKDWRPHKRTRPAATTLARVRPAV